jgi:hypothetical protein
VTKFNAKVLEVYEQFPGFGIPETMLAVSTRLMEWQ